MNSTIMIQNREYADLLHVIETSINDQLIKHAEKLFGRSLSTKEANDLKSMNVDDKNWLLQQYQEEIKFNKQPDLSHLY